MGLLVLLLIIINITATYIIRSVLCSKSFASKDRNRNIKIIGRFNLIKFPICLISSIYITYYFSQVLHSNSLILKLSTAYITFVLVNIDAIIMYRPVKEIRLLEINLFTYMKSTVVENIMIFIPWCLAVLVRDIIPNNSKDSYFFVFYFMVWGIYIIIQPFLTRFVLNAKRISIDENKIIGEDLNRNFGCSFSLFQYDGKRKKSANAMVEGYLNRYYVYISDYLVENISVDEVRAIILHEIGHIKKHHILVRNIIIMGLMPLLYFVGLIMDNINKFFQVEINLILGCVIMLSIVIGYSVFMYLFICRIQEYQADAFAVHQGVKAKLLCDALVRLAELNDTVKNISKVEQSLSTHPTIEKRVNKLLGIKEG